MIKDREKYLEKKIKVTCPDGKIFTGLMQGMGSSVDGFEIHEREEEFIEVGDTILFESEIESIEIIE